MRCIKVFLLLSLLLAGSPSQSPAQQPSFEQGAGGVVTGSVWELRNSRRVLLLVRRSVVLDSRGLAKSILAEAYRTDPDARHRYPRLYNTIARKLNNYIRKYQSITAVRNVPEADFIVFFNLLEYRRPLGIPYPYGELFVILNNRTTRQPPRIVWKTRKSSMWAEDAIEEFIKDLKAVRGED
jgi:hypothetical protein